MIREVAGSRLSSFACADVLISTDVLIHSIGVEGRSMSVANIWLPIAGTCLISNSLGLTLFLAMRENEVNKQEGNEGAKNFAD